MKELATSYGRVFIGTKEDGFRTAVFLAAAQRGKNTGRPYFTWALTGGTTPAEWYRWCVAQQALPPPLLAGTQWFTSDERHVPLDSPDSNFGNAARQLLAPLAVPAAKMHPWPVALPAPDAANEFARQSAAWFQPGKAFDLCFLGLGPEGHTASFFPGSPLLESDGGAFFAAVNVPGKGWRLTITPTGLRACGLIVVIVSGAAKAEAMHRVLAGPYDPETVPAQILKSCSSQVVWLLDEAAAAGFLA